MDFFEGGYDTLIFDLRKPSTQLEHFIFKGDTYIQVYNRNKEEIISAVKLEDTILENFNFLAYHPNKNSPKTKNMAIGYIPEEIESIELYDVDKPYIADQAKKIDELIARGKAKKSFQNLDIGFNSDEQKLTTPLDFTVSVKKNIDGFSK